MNRTRGSQSSTGCLEHQSDTGVGRHDEWHRFSLPPTLCGGFGSRTGFLKQKGGDVSKSNGAMQPETILDLARAAVLKRNEQITARLRAGETLDSVGVEFGLSKQRVGQIGRSAGLFRGRALAVRLDEVRRLCGLGMTPQAISAALGVSMATVANDLSRLGIQRVRQNKDHRLKATAMLLTTTKSQTEIARECNTNHETVAWIKGRLTGLGFKCRCRDGRKQAQNGKAAT